jgi:hypothetical protein
MMVWYKMASPICSGSHFVFDVPAGWFEILWRLASSRWMVILLHHIQMDGTLTSSMACSQFTLKLGSVLLTKRRGMAADH